MNENTRLSTALFEEAFANILRECKEHQEIVRLKIQVALANWALAKMGKQGERYQIRALEEFLVRAAKLMVTESWDGARVLREIPIVIPASPPGTNPSEYQLLTNPNLLQIQDDYLALCVKVKELKNKNKTDTGSFKRDLKKILKGRNQKWIDKIDLSAEPSDIVTLYLTKEYRRLGIKPEMLKKRFATMKHFRGRSDSVKSYARLQKWLNGFIPTFPR